MSSRASTSSRLFFAMVVCVLVQAAPAGGQGQDAQACLASPDRVWNGYQCMAIDRSPTRCGIRVPPGVTPRCVEGGGRTSGPGWWYIHVGGQRTDWNQGTDALCATAQEAGNYKVGLPAPWGAAHCISAGTQEECERVASVLGWCAQPPPPLALGACEWVAVGGHLSHFPPEDGFCGPSRVITGIDLDLAEPELRQYIGNTSVMARVRCCRTEPPSPYDKPYWAKVGERFSQSPDPRGLCGTGFLTALDLDSGAGSAFIGKQRCLDLAHGARSCRWVNVGEERSHSPLEGSLCGPDEAIHSVDLGSTPQNFFLDAVFCCHLGPSLPPAPCHLNEQERRVEELMLDPVGKARPDLKAEYESLGLRQNRGGWVPALTPYYWSFACHPTLSRVARERAEVIARKRGGDLHCDPEPWRLATERAGYGRNTIESIAAHATPDDAFNGWMHSVNPDGRGGHRRQILGPGDDHVHYGIGAVNGYYVVITGNGESPTVSYPSMCP